MINIEIHLEQFGDSTKTAMRLIPDGEGYESNLSSLSTLELELLRAYLKHTVESLNMAIHIRSTSVTL